MSYAQKTDWIVFVIHPCLLLKKNFIENERKMPILLNKTFEYELLQNPNSYEKSSYEKSSYAVVMPFRKVVTRFRKVVTRFRKVVTIRSLMKYSKKFVYYSLK